MTATFLAPTTETDTDRRPSTTRSDGIDARHVREYVRSTGELLAGLPTHDPRWSLVGRMVSELSDAIRRAVGQHVPAGVAAPQTPIIHIRDLAVAGRRLFGPDVAVVDPGAAHRARVLSEQIGLALG